MTISSSTNKVLLNGDGSTTTFTFNFALLKSDYSDLYVYQIDVDEDTQEETQTLLTAGVDYNISVLKDTNLNILGGSITTTFIPTINQKIFIIREENLLQETKIEINQKFPERVIELTLDKLTLQNQQQQSLIDKCLKISQTSDAVISGFADTPVENMGVVWKKNENGEFYLSNTQDNPDTIYNDIVNNPNVIAVGTNIDNVNSVASNSSNINSIAGDLTNIDNVASDLTNISNVANDLSNVDIVATNIANVNTNATNISDINTNATNISNINIVATNISDIQDKANKDLDNITNTAKDNITSIVGLKKINEFEIEDGDAEVEITEIGQKETIIEIDNLLANNNPCNIDSLLGNSGSYYNSDYKNSYFSSNSDISSNWIGNSGWNNSSSVSTLTYLKYSDWSLSSTLPAKLHLVISPIMNNNTIYLTGYSMLVSTGNPAYLINFDIKICLYKATLDVDRIKIYLNGSTFKAGNVKVYQKL